MERASSLRPILVDYICIKSREEKEGKEKISNEGEVEQLTQEEKEEAAGQESGEPGRRRSYASVAREAVKPTVHRGVTTRSRAREDGGFQAIQL